MLLLLRMAGLWCINAHCLCMHDSAYSLLFRVRVSSRIFPSSRYHRSSTLLHTSELCLSDWPKMVHYNHCFSSYKHRMWLKVWLIAVVSLRGDICGRTGEVSTLLPAKGSLMAQALTTTTTTTRHGSRISRFLSDHKKNKVSQFLPTKLTHRLRNRRLDGDQHRRSSKLPCPCPDDNPNNDNHKELEEVLQDQQEALFSRLGQLWAAGLVPTEVLFRNEAKQGILLEQVS